MILSYLVRRQKWALEVTFPSGVVRRYGPVYGRQEALTFLSTRLVPNTYVGEGHRSVQQIVSARVVRQRRVSDRPTNDLLGVRLQLP